MIKTRTKKERRRHYQLLQQEGRLHSLLLLTEGSPLLSSAIRVHYLVLQAGRLHHHLLLRGE